MIDYYLIIESITKISLIFMSGLVGLSNDPRDEQFGLFPGLGQQFEGDHIEHLYGLVEGGIEGSQVVEPHQQEEDNRDYDEDVEQDGAEVDQHLPLAGEAALPSLEHQLEGRHHVQLIRQPNLVSHLRLRGYQVFGVNLISAFQLAAHQILALSEIGVGEAECVAKVAEVYGVIDGCDVGQVEGEYVIVE